MFHRQESVYFLASVCREIVKSIDLKGTDMVFVVGGNGGNAGAAAIQVRLRDPTEARRRAAPGLCGSQASD
jgi:hypothetical protein